MVEMFGIAHSRNQQPPELTRETADELYGVYDANHDGRVTIDDIISLASRYLSY